MVSAYNNNFVTVFRIMEELSGGCKSINGPVRTLTVEFSSTTICSLREEGASITTVNCITCVEAALLVDETVSHGNMRIPATPPNKIEIIMAINALKQTVHRNSCCFC